MSIQPNPEYGYALNQYLVEIMNEHDLTQMNKNPTRLNEILDLVFTTNPDLVGDVRVEPGMSDHDIIITEVNMKMKLREKRPRKLYICKLGNMSAIKDEMKQFYAEVIQPHIDEMSAEEMWAAFSNKLSESINKNIPQKNISERWNLPWVTSKMRRIIRKKQRLYRKAKHSTREQDWKVFKDI